MKKILFIFLPLIGITLLLVSFFIITSLSSETVEENCGAECKTQNETQSIPTATPLQVTLAATLQIILDDTVPVISYSENVYEDNPDYNTLVQQVLFGVDESGYILEYGVNTTKENSSQSNTPIIYPSYLSLTVKYKVVDSDISMTFLDYEVDGIVDEVYVNDVQITDEEILTDAQLRYEAELGITAAYYFGVNRKVI